MRCDYNAIRLLPSDSANSPMTAALAEKFAKSQHVSAYQHYQQYVNGILRHYLTENLSFECLMRLMKLINKAPNVSIQLPETKSKILNLFWKGEEPKLKYYTECESCKKYTENVGRTRKVTCGECNALLESKETNFFIYFPIETQLKKCIEDNWSSLCHANNNGEGAIDDVHSGKILKKIEKKYELTASNILSLGLNVDGAHKHKSNKLALWAIQIIPNFLPPSMRYNKNNIIVAGLYYSRKKPNCLEYFYPLVKEMKKLAVDGVWTNNKTEKFKFLPFITHCTVDLPAKSLLQQIIQFNGYAACTYCLHPGEQVSIQKKKGKYVVRKYVRYTWTENIHSLRDHAETLDAMRRIANSREILKLNGVQGK